MEEDPIRVRIDVGSRVIELATSRTGNKFTPAGLLAIRDKLRLFGDSDIVSCSIIASETPDLFSIGFDRSSNSSSSSSSSSSSNSDNNSSSSSGSSGSTLDGVATDGTAATLAAANKLAMTIETLEKVKPIITVYSGLVGATAYSAFAASTYRLATQSAQFRVMEDVAQGVLPLGGGLAYHLARLVGCVIIIIFITL
jgi:enoyl-CoA hydratase/carnithine racemase